MGAALIVWGRTMAAYRCYLVGADARIAALETLDCGDDEEASQTAEAIAEARQYWRAEVWDRDRLVARIALTRSMAPMTARPNKGWVD
jgi:hypothetical protein